MARPVPFAEFAVKCRGHCWHRPAGLSHAGTPCLATSLCATGDLVLGPRFRYQQCHCVSARLGRAPQALPSLRLRKGKSEHSAVLPLVRTACSAACVLGASVPSPVQSLCDIYVQWTGPLLMPRPRACTQVPKDRAEASPGHTKRGATQRITSIWSVSRCLRLKPVHYLASLS